MLRRLTLGFAGVLAAAVSIVACSSSDATQTISVGPNFPPQTLYAADVTQNAINIYSPNPKSTAGPQYQIGGGSTTLSGPQYLTFDSNNDLFVTNWVQSSDSGSLLEFQALATGNVLPYQTYIYSGVRPRGIASTPFTFAAGSSAGNLLAVAVTDPSQPSGYQSLIELFEANALSIVYETIGGPGTGINVASGLAFDAKSNLYVANLQGKSVEVFAIAPTPSPTPSTSPTASPTVTPSPTPTPVGATPTPVPTTTPLALTPTATISGAATELGEPTGIAVDSSTNIYVADQASTVCAPACPAILIFAAGSNGNVAPKAIAGSNTLLAAPTDVKVDPSGNIYVADTAAGSGVVYVYSKGSTGNVAPSATLKSPGALVGIGLVP